MRQFVDYLTKQGVSFAIAPSMRRFGDRKLHSVRRVGFGFLVATFSHPTKSPRNPAGRAPRVSWVTWRQPVPAESSAYPLNTHGS